jgi:hypothetical protein
VLHSWWLAADVTNPAIHFSLSGAGAAAWFGWPEISDVDAIAAVGRNLPWRDDEARRQKQGALPATVRRELDSLDQAFFRYPNDLMALLYEYVTKHRDQIGAPADF